MKTTKIYSTSLLILILIFATGLKANMLLAASVVDNPPTSYNEYTNTTSDFDFEDEAYIDDIPFDTECVSKNCGYEKAVSEVFNLPEEPYINDIPFNTAKVAKELKNQNASVINLKFEEEEYIDDIPFSTIKVTHNLTKQIILITYSK